MSVSQQAYCCSKGGCGQGRGADLCRDDLVLAVPWALASRLPPARAARSPQLSLQCLQVLLVLRAGSLLLQQLLPEGIWRRKSSSRSGTVKTTSVLQERQSLGWGGAGSCWQLWARFSKLTLRQQKWLSI